MKNPVPWLAVLLVSAIPTSVGAVPVVNISWDHCTGPIERAVLPGQSVSIYASVLGHSQPHRAYLVQLLLGTYAPIPDAWRFDAGGCQGPARLTIDHLAPAEVALACPSFQGTLPSFQAKAFEYNPTSGVAQTSLAVAYPNGGLGNTTQVDPTRRYFLGRWQFDHTASVNGPGTPGVTCGGVDVPMSLASFSTGGNPPASWVNLDGQIVGWKFYNEGVTAHNIIGCPGGSGPPIPVRNSTWGAIKNQYR